MAAVLAGFGPFVAVFLGHRGWSQQDIGFVLSAASIAGLLSQIPGGELLDATHSKRFLFGCATLLLLYAVLAWRIWHAAQVAKDTLGTLVCVGVLAMILFQVFENVGMTMGIMPVTGIPLPFMSYGGSSTITMFAAIGLVSNVHMRRFS